MARRIELTDDELRTIAKQYSSKNDLRNNNNSVYSLIHKRNKSILDEVFPSTRKKPTHSWNEKTLRAISPGFNSMAELKSIYPGVANAFNGKYIDLRKELFPAPEDRKENGYWTLEACIAEAETCKTMKEFRTTKKDAYNASIRKHREWLTARFPSKKKKPSIKWNEPNLREVSKQFDNYKALQEAYPGANTAFYTKFTELREELWPSSKESWTLENILDKAGKCSSYNEFQDKYPGGYEACRTQHKEIFKSLFKYKYEYWPKDRIIEKAMLCSSKSDFKKKFVSAYNALERYPGLSDELFDDKHITWSKETLLLKSLECNSIGEFQKKYPGGYAPCQRQFTGYLDELFIRQIEYWPEEKIIEKMLECSSKQDFRDTYPSGYNSCHKYFPGLIDKYLENQSIYSSNDMIYLWWTGEADIYKLGVTSERKGNWRINQVARFGNFRSFEVIRLTKVLNAKILENKLLKYGKPVDFDEKFTGYTEFRRFTNEELKQITSIIDSEQIFLVESATTQ